MKGDEEQEGQGISGGIGVSIQNCLKKRGSVQESEFLQKYKELMGTQGKIRFHVLCQELRTAGIDYDPAQDSDHLRLNLIHHSHDYQVLSFQISMGPFSTCLMVCQSQKESGLHESSCLYGNCGNIYLLEIGEQLQLAVKCIQFKQQQGQQIDRNNTILRTLKQYFLAKIASALKVGPRLIKFLQFDLILYGKCIQFWMQRCCLEEQVVVHQQSKAVLKKSLRILHELKITHCDIKSQNIVFSPHYRKPVFIDFGVSKIVSKPPGYKFRTKFAGTLQVCSPQMAQLYIKSKEDFIDLYYNDAHCFSKSLLSDLTCQTRTPLQQITRYFNPDEADFDLIKIQYYLFEDRIHDAINLLIRSKRRSTECILTFISQLTPTENLRQFYQKYLAQEWNGSIRFNQLQKIYKYNRKFHIELSERKQQLDSHIRPPSIIKLMDNNRMSLERLDNGSGSLQPQTPTLQDCFDTFIQKMSICHRKKHQLTRQQKQKQLKQFITKFEITSQQPFNFGDCFFQCLDYLINLCLTVPLTCWKYNNIEALLTQKIIVKALTAEQKLNYFRKILKFDVKDIQKSNFVFIVVKIMIYGRIIHGQLTKEQTNKKQDRVSILQNSFLKLTQGAPASQKIMKFDLLILKSIQGNLQVLPQLISLQQEVDSFPQPAKTLRKQYISLLRIFILQQSKQLEKERMLICAQLKLAKSCLKLLPEHIMLAKVYFNLMDYKKGTEIIKFIDAVIASPEISRKCLFYQRVIAEFMYPQATTIHFIQFQFCSQYYSLAKLSIALFYTFCKIKNKRLNSHKHHHKSILKFYEVLYAIKKQENILQKINKLKLKTISKFIEQDLQNRLIDFIKQSVKPQFWKTIQKNFQNKKISQWWAQQDYLKIVSQFNKQVLIKKLLNNSSDTLTFDYYLRSLIQLKKYQTLSNVLRCFHQNLIRNTDRFEWWYGKFSLVLLFDSLIHSKIWSKFGQILLMITQFVDNHPTKANINTYICCLRYAFSRPVDIPMLDNGLKTVTFMGYEWNHSYLAFFHIQAIKRMSSILSIAELKSLLYKLAKFLPFLPHFGVEWILQQYYTLYLSTNLRQRNKKWILRQCSKLIKYCPYFGSQTYKLHRISIQNCEQNLMKAVQLNIQPQIQIIKECPQIIGCFQSNKLSWWLKKKLKHFHGKVGNKSMQMLQLNRKVLMRYEME